MTGRHFVDTNILIYSLDPADVEKRRRAADVLLAGNANGRLVLSPQSLNETYRILTERRRLMPQLDARRFVATLIPFCIASLTAATTLRAWTIQDETGFHWWDCLLLAAALDAGCIYFVTEDLHAGRVIDGMQLVDPFRVGTDHPIFSG